MDQVGKIFSFCVVKHFFQVVAVLSPSCFCFLFFQVLLMPLHLELLLFFLLFFEKKVFHGVLEVEFFSLLPTGSQVTNSSLSIFLCEVCLFGVVFLLRNIAIIFISQVGTIQCTWQLSVRLVLPGISTGKALPIFPAV